jgi:hypothetical protein
LSGDEGFATGSDARDFQTIQASPNCVEIIEDCLDIKRNEFLSPIQLVSDDQVCAKLQAAGASDEFLGSNSKEISNEEHFGSQLKPMLNIGDHDHNRRRRTETRESTKSVRWDPAVVSVGRRLVDRPLEITMPTPELPSNQDMVIKILEEEYVKNFTHSLVKLKKSNPRLIDQLLAALRSSKFDDGSGNENAQRQDESKTILPRQELESSIIPSGEGVKEQTRAASENEEPVNRDNHPNFNNETLMPTAERVIGDANLVEEDPKFIHRAMQGAHERYPEAIKSSSGEASKPKGGMDRETKVPLSYADALKSPLKALKVEELNPFENLNLKRKSQISYADAARPARKIKDVQKPHLASNSGPPKLNPTAAPFRDLSDIKFRAVQWQCEDVEGVSPVPRKRGLTENATYGGSEQRHSEDGCQSDYLRDSGLSPTAKPFNMSGKQQVIKNESIWIKASNHIQATENLETSGFSNGGQLFIDPNNFVPAAPMPIAQPLLKLPPGCIPLVPLPHFMPPLPMLPPMPTPIFPPGPPTMLQYPLPMLPELQIAAPDIPETLKSDPASTDSALQPSEDEHGRVARALEEEWAAKVLKGFQDRYPQTGTRAPPPAPHPPALPRVDIQSAYQAPNTQDPRLNFKAPLRLNKKPKCHRSLLANKQRAAEIQQQLEIKILEQKEKEARERKELQLRAVENVNNYLAERKLRLERQVNKSESSQPSQSSSLSIMSEEWKETWAALLEKINQKRGSADFQQTALIPSSVVQERVPKHVWEYFSMEEWQSRPMAEAQGLSQMDEDGMPEALLAVAEQNLPIQRTRRQNLDESQRLTGVQSRNGSEAPKKAVETKASEVSWEHATLERLQLNSSLATDLSPKSNKCLWEYLDLGLKTEDLKSVAQGPSRSSSNTTVSEKPSQALTHGVESSMEELGKHLNFEFVSRVSSTSVSVTSLDSDEFPEMPSSSKSKGKWRNSTDERAKELQCNMADHIDGHASRSTSDSSRSAWLIDLAEEAGEEKEADDQTQE